MQQPIAPGALPQVGPARHPPLTRPVFHQHPVRDLDGRQAVGDDHCGTTAQECPQRRAASTDLRADRCGRRRVSPNPCPAGGSRPSARPLLPRHNHRLIGVVIGSTGSGSESIDQESRSTSTTIISTPPVAIATAWPAALCPSSVSRALLRVAASEKYRSAIR
jgi:hypothetical protein